MSDTPITDANAIPLPVPKGEKSQGYVAASIVRTLERENAAMREAIREADGALRKCLNYMLILPMSGSDAECEAMDDSHHALATLQPFLKP